MPHGAVILSKTYLCLPLLLSAILVPNFNKNKNSFNPFVDKGLRQTPKGLRWVGTLFLINIEKWQIDVSVGRIKDLWQFRSMLKKINNVYKNKLDKVS